MRSLWFPASCKGAVIKWEKVMYDRWGVVGWRLRSTPIFLRPAASFSENSFKRQRFPHASMTSFVYTPTCVWKSSIMQSLARFLVQLQWITFMNACFDHWCSWNYAIVLHCNFAIFSFHLKAASEENCFRTGMKWLSKAEIGISFTIISYLFVYFYLIILQYL